MFKQKLWLLLILAAILSVGCASENLPLPQVEENLSPAAPANPTTVLEPVEETTPAAYPVVEATMPGPATEAYPGVETRQENLTPQPTKTPEPLATDTPIAEEALELQPISPKQDLQTLKLINLAKADLAGRLSIKLPSTAIKVVAIEEVIWRDSSLGCPEPGMIYAQGMVDGYVIQLQVGDQVYNYHGAKGEDPFLCLKTSGLEAEPQPGDALQESAGETYNAQTQRAINLAKADLMNTLGVEFSAIALVSYEEVTWNDGSLGCPQPDMMYTQALIDGYLIQLEVEGQVYNYHGATGEDPFLCTN